MPRSKMSAKQVWNQLNRRKEWSEQQLRDMLANGRGGHAVMGARLDIEALNYAMELVAEKRAENALLQAATDARLALDEHG
jgi:hypothetical protein